MTARTAIGCTVLLLLTTAVPALASEEARVVALMNARNPFAHNFGPGPWPGTVVTYDGPTSALCKQGAAAYRGQDGKRHPCN